MHLAEIAAHQFIDSMEGWDPARQAFVPGAFVGLVTLTDRFLSNFNKPLRRRMLMTRPGTAMPASRVIRHPLTQDIYLIGQTRTDVRNGQATVDLSVLQLATDTPMGSAGLATITRKVAKGPAGDPGHLVDTIVAKSFVDLEFRTSQTEEETFEIKVANYFAFLPQTLRLQAWDFLELHGRRMRVVDVFPDSGLLGLRVDEEPDRRLDFVLQVPGTRVYDKATHTYSQAERRFNVTGVMVRSHDYAAWSGDSDDYLDVSFETEHLPLAPRPGMSLELEGRSRVVKQVDTQPGTRQYLLRCV